MVNLKMTVGLLITAICTSVATAALAAPPPGIPDGWSEGFVYANGIRIHYYHAIPERGKPVLVMVHGVTDIGLSWTTLTKDLEKSYDIYMPDARGHGLSDPLTDRDNGQTLVKDLVGFIRAMHFKKPILMGHSMGAATVMRVGADYPDLPRAVIMLDPLLGPLPKWLGAPQRAGAAGTRGGAAATPSGALVMFGTPEALVAQNNIAQGDLVAECRKQNPKWDPVDCQYWALSKEQYHGAYSTAQMHAITGAMELGNSLARITARSLILKADAPADVRAANLKAASVMKNGKLIHVDNAAHNLHHDQRAKVVELVTEFLRKL